MAVRDASARALGTVVARRAGVLRSLMQLMLFPLDVQCTRLSLRSDGDAIIENVWSGAIEQRPHRLLRWADERGMARREYREREKQRPAARPLPRVR